MSAGRHQVVVVGGGFGGIRVIRALARSDVDITIVDRTNHHLFQPLLYQAMAPVLLYYASTDPRALWQAGGATALFIAGSGAIATPPGGTCPGWPGCPSGHSWRSSCSASC